MAPVSAILRGEAFSPGITAFVSALVDLGLSKNRRYF